MNIILSIAFMLACSFLIACGTLLTKLIGNSSFGDGIHPIQIAYSRFFFGFIILLIISIFLKPKINVKNINLHFLRSFFGIFGVSIWFTAILYIPISDATAINFLNPIFAMILAVFFLNEKVGVFRWSAALISLIGGIILIRPSYNLNVDPIALMCLLGALSFGFEIICIKILSGKENVLNILLINNFCASLFGLLLILYVFKLPSLYEVFALISVASFFIFGQFFFLNSIKRVDASFVIPFFYATLIFVTLLDFFIFKIFPDKISFLGAFLIILGGLIITYREIISKNKN